MRRIHIPLLLGAALIFGCSGSDNGGSSTGGSGGSRMTGGAGGATRTGGSGGAGGGLGSGGASGNGGDGGSTGGSADSGTSAGGTSGTDASVEVDAAPAAPSDGGAEPDAVSTSNGDGAAPAGDGTFAVPPGMTQIFDGKSLNGWKGNMAVWTLNTADQAIEGKTPASNGGTFIFTNDSYDDFRLVLTERMIDTENHLGVCFWATGNGGNGSNGCLDVIPPSGHIWDYGGGGDVPNTGVGSANNDVKYKWHQVEILAVAATGQILVAINGVQATTYMKADRAKKAPIGLQAHSKESHPEYKDVWVEIAPKDHTLLTLKKP